MTARRRLVLMPSADLDAQVVEPVASSCAAAVPWWASTPVLAGIAAVVGALATLLEAARG